MELSYRNVVRTLLRPDAVQSLMLVAWQGMESRPGVSHGMHDRHEAQRTHTLDRPRMCHAFLKSAMSERS